MNLRDVLKNSYADKNKQKTALNKYGYNIDPQLSNENHQTYYNPKENKLLYSVTGTKSLSDWGTDAYLLAGKLKDTNRYKNDDKAFKDAKTKYAGSSNTVVGHSLGSSIGAGIASASDKFYGLDGGITFGQKTRSNNGNHQHFRSSGDVVSLLGANATHMKTLTNPNFRTGIAPIDIVKAHDINNIKNAGIFI